MKATVRLFAQARQSAGTDFIELELPSDATVGDLRRAMLSHCPSLADLLPYCHIAVDTEYASDTTPIEENSEIALIPPVSGG